jgi:hypothetical protein
MRFVQILAVLVFLLPSSVIAQESGKLVPSSRAAMKAGFEFPDGKPARIILFRPDISVGEQNAGGLDLPNAEWTQKSRAAIISALHQEQKSRQNILIELPELSGDDAALMADYRSLFQVVTSAAITHKLFPGNKLPTKSNSFDWSLGQGISQVPGVKDADFGLFFFSYDSFPSAASNKSALVGSLFGQAADQASHISYAGLIDMRSGDLVWLSTDLKIIGDVRTASGATKRIAKLLKDFPLKRIATKATVKP